MSRTFGKRVISIAAYFSLLLVFLLDVGFVSTSAEPAQEQVQRFFETYIASVGNNFVAADALTAVGGTAMKEYFIRHAVDGVMLIFSGSIVKAQGRCGIPKGGFQRFLCIVVKTSQWLYGILIPTQQAVAPLVIGIALKHRHRT